MGRAEVRPCSAASPAPSRRPHSCAGAAQMAASWREALNSNLFSHSPGEGFHQGVGRAVPPPKVLEESPVPASPRSWRLLVLLGLCPHHPNPASVLPWSFLRVIESPSAPLARGDNPGRSHLKIFNLMTSAKIFLPNRSNAQAPGIRTQANLWGASIQRLGGFLL